MNSTSTINHILWKTLSFLFVNLLNSASCGANDWKPHQYLEDADESNNQYKGAVINGTISYDDCYDVSLLQSDPSDPNSRCSALRIYAGVFLTAAHCVTSTRPDTTPRPSKWKTDSISITFVPDAKGRSYIGQTNSIQVIVPPAVSNFSNAQWRQLQGSPDDMISTDVAIVIVADRQERWDQYLSPAFDAPAANDLAYIAGYGYGVLGGDGSLSDPFKRRYGATHAISLTNQMITFFGDKPGVPGDSGGPIYAANGGQDRRTVIGINSSYRITTSPGSGRPPAGYNYSANLSTLGGMTNYGWLETNISQARQVVSCLDNAADNAVNQCAP